MRIGGESIEVQVDSSSLPENYSELKNILQENGKWTEFLDNIRDTLKFRKPIKDIELENLIESDHLIPNASIEDLKSRFPEAGFPEDSNLFKISTKKVLLVSKYKTKRGNLLYGRIINKDGKEIFIVDALHVKTLAQYFELQQRIISTNLIDQLDKSVLDKLDLIYDKALENFTLKRSLEQYVQSKKDSGVSEDRLKREALLILFSQNKSPFRSILYEYNPNNTYSKDKNGKIKSNKENSEESYGSFSFLSDLAKDILGVKNNKNKYSDRIVDGIVTSISKYSVDFREAYLSKDILLDIMPNELKQIFIDNQLSTKDGKVSSKKANAELNKSIKDNRELFSHIFGEEVISRYDENVDGWGILTQEFLNRDKTFNYVYKSQEKSTITLEQFSKTLYNTYGIGQEELLKMDEPKYYKGKYILTKVNKDGSKSYFVSDYYTIESAYDVSKFDTEEKAQEYIKSQNETIVDHSYKQLHAFTMTEDGTLISDDKNNLVINTIKYIPEKTILTLLDYDVPSLNLDLIPAEMKGFISSNEESKTMEDFKNFVEATLDSYLENSFYPQKYKEDILSYIDTPEKVFLFISQLNNPKYKKDLETGELRPINLKDKSEVLELATEIGTIKNKRYYYVKKYNNKIITLIPFKPEILSEYRKNRKYPVRNVLTAAQAVLAPKLGGVKLNILTSEEIDSTIEGEYDITAKAFIKNGEIYINKDLANPEDLFHEYVHILLGYLKFNDDTKDLYRQLLEEVWNFEKNDSIRDDIKNTYEHYALIDQMEEYFATKFGNWIKNNSKIGFGNIFNNGIFAEGTKLLFDPNNKSKSIKELYGKTLYDVFLNFNSEIAQYLEENKTLDNGEFANLFTAQRKKTQWIRQQISDGKLEEFDCV